MLALGLASGTAPEIKEMIGSGRQPYPERWTSRRDESYTIERVLVEVLKKTNSNEMADILAELATDQAVIPFFTEVGEGIEKDRPY